MVLKCKNDNDKKSTLQDYLKHCRIVRSPVRVVQIYTLVFWFRDFFYSRHSIFLRFFFRGILFVVSFFRDFFYRQFSPLPTQRLSQFETLRYPEIVVRVTGSAMFFSFCDDVIDLTRQNQPFFRGRHQFTRRRFTSSCKSYMMEQRASF